MRLTSGVGPVLFCFSLSVVVAASCVETSAEESGRRPLRVEDYFAIKGIDEPRISPEGAWVAYTIETTDLEKNDSETRLWMVPAGGGESIPMTSKGSSASSPRWSPDGRFLSFLSDRKDEVDQVWVLDRRGGEARQLTEVKQGVKAYEWSPDGGRLVLVIRDPKKDEKDEKNEKKTDKKKTPDPWVIDRLQFKRDYDGYLDRRRNHLYIFDLKTKQPVQITSGDFDDSGPAWSPDGRVIAFSSNRTEDPDANYNSDIWLVTADNTDKGKTLVRVTGNPGSDTGPIWHPDGDRLAYITTTNPKIADYAQTRLAVIRVGEGEPKILTRALDRVVADPRFSSDGGTILFLMEDHGSVDLASIPTGGGEVRRPITGEQRVEGYSVGPKNKLVALISRSREPGDLYALNGSGGKHLRLTEVNGDLLAQLKTAGAEKVTFASPDGTKVDAFIYKPPGFDPEFRYPTILWPHGGPQAQYDFGWDFEAQLFAANGYVVVMPNPRGSTGYGLKFTLGIWADWGNADTQDALAAIDHSIKLGYSDPDRLGVGGWSYGGILTNYVITTTDRFAAAVSGASLALYAANYGHDHYQHWYEMEFGLPWETRDLWERLSPFNRVEKITTPTLWIGGEKDWNVPIQNSEQMYQAMKRLGRETMLVVYPDQHHGIDKPSYTKDMYERFLGWYGKYLKPE